MIPTCQLYRSSFTRSQGQLNIWLPLRLEYVVYVDFSWVLDKWICILMDQLMLWVGKQILNYIFNEYLPDLCQIERGSLMVGHHYVLVSTFTISSSEDIFAAVTAVEDRITVKKIKKPNIDKQKWWATEIWNVISLKKW